VHGATFEVQHGIGPLHSLPSLGAAQRRRKPGGPTQHSTVRPAQADRHQPLVLRRAVEQRLQATTLRVRHRLGNRVRQRIGNQCATQVEVVLEPAQRQPVHQRQGKTGNRTQREYQWNEKAQLKAEHIHGRFRRPIPACLFSRAPGRIGQVLGHACGNSHCV